MCCENFREISWTDLVYGALVDWWTVDTKYSMAAWRSVACAAGVVWARPGPI